MQYPEIVISFPNITISGSSISEDPSDFWDLKIKEFNRIAFCWEKVTVNFILDYYNTGTLFYLTGILKIFKKMSEHADVKINWYYLPADTDMFEMGFEFKKSMKIDLKLIKRQD